MEENNNNDNKAMEQIKGTAKNEAKKLGKNIGTKIVKWVWPVIITLLIILLSFGVINLVVYTVQSFFSSLLSAFSATEEASSSSTNQTQSIIYIDKDGAYAYNEDFAEQLAEKLENQKVETEALGFSVDEFGDMLQTYIKTEVQTMLPKIGSYAKDGLDGNIIIKRATIDGKTKTLSYMPYEDFKIRGTVNEFSINPENFKLCLYVAERY